MEYLDPHCQQLVQDVTDDLDCIAAALITNRVLHEQNTASYDGGLANLILEIWKGTSANKFV